MNETELRKLDDEMVGAYIDRNIDVILSHCSDDILMHDYGQEPVQGKAACREYLTNQFAPMSAESAVHVKRVFGDNQVFGELEWTATNTGDLELPDGTTVPATGKTIDVRIAYYASINDNGEVDEIRGYPDIMAMMGQLGILG